MANPWEMEWDNTEEHPSVSPWEMDFTSSEEGPWEEEWGVDPVESVFSGLGLREGVGDNVTDIPTGALGVTQAARKAVGDSGNLSDTDVARSYLTQLHGKWQGIEGYLQAPTQVQEAILDASYNMGGQVLDFKKLRESLKKGEYEGAVKELLDTASVDGKSVKGLAKRRAEMYNQFAIQKITQVEQLEDGTIIYRSGDEEVLKYKAKGGKHEKSDPGTMDISANGL